MNFDENDGFFDHVVAPTPPTGTANGLSTVDTVNEIYPGVPGVANFAPGPYGLGARVPCFVVSPWSRGGWACSQVFDHTSVIQFIEKRFGVTESHITPWRRAISGEPLVKQTGVAISRVLVPDTSNGLIDDYEQWFNGPNRLLSFRVPPGHIYVACAFPIPPEAEITPHQKSPEALRKAYTPHHSAPSAQVHWMIETICANTADTHWARMQEHELLYRAADCNVLYLGDAAHGMVPTLGQGATQALEDAANAAALITRRHNAGEVSHTAKFAPWRIKTAIAFIDRKRAAEFERYLKTASGRAFAKRHFGV